MDLFVPRSRGRVSLFFITKYWISRGLVRKNILDHALSNPLNFISYNLRPVFGYGDVVLFGYPTSGVAHLVAEQVGGEVLFGEAGAVGVAKVVVFEVDS